MAKRTFRKGAQARERVLDAVVDMVGRAGLAKLSVAEIADAAGMSAGHVLYYFGTKDTLFVEALKHVESALEPKRAAIAASPVTAARRLSRYIKLYLPTTVHDPRWALWIEVWNQSLTDPELCQTQLELDAHWQRDLVAIVDAGIAEGDFHPADPRLAADTIAALLDGLAIRTVTGAERVDPAAARRMAERGCHALLVGHADRDP